MAFQIKKQLFTVSSQTFVKKLIRLKLLLLVGFLFVGCGAETLSPTGTAVSASCSANPVSSFIINGNEVNQAPSWMLSYQTQINGEWTHRCGASLISPTWVLTAAHCVQEGDHIHSASEGRLQINSKTLYSGELVRIRTVIPHPGYELVTGSSFRVDNDIALLELSSPLTISPILLDLSQVNSNIDDFNEYDLYGWGNTERNRLSDILRTTTMDQIDTSYCEDRYDHYDSSTQYCFRSSSRNTGACSGDSGSPGIVTLSNGVEFQVGVASYVTLDRKGRCDASGSVVYMSVRSYMPWIRSHVRNLPQYQEPSPAPAEPAPSPAPDESGPSPVQPIPQPNPGSSTQC